VASVDAYVRGLRLPAAEGDAIFRDISARAPREPYVWLMWGDLSARQNRFSDAIQQYQTAVSLRPWLLRAHLGLVASNWALKHYDRAAQALADARNINSRHPDVVAWRDRIRGRV
jgi:predicted Zn-dependent protease